MRDGKMRHVRQPVTPLPRRRLREQRMSRAVQARRRLPSPRGGRPSQGGGRASQGGGRAWINGREVGGADPRYAHLSTVND